MMASVTMCALSVEGWTAEMSDYLLDKWTEDIVIYEGHAQLCLNMKNRIIDEFKRAGRSPPMSAQGRLYDIDVVIKEYEDDIAELRVRIADHVGE